MKIFKLVLGIAGGDHVSVLVTEEVGDMFVVEWQNWESKPDTGEKTSSIRSLQGFLDSGDRAECKLHVDLNAVYSVFMVYLYGKNS